MHFDGALGGLHDLGDFSDRKPLMVFQYKRCSLLRWQRFQGFSYFAGQLTCHDLLVGRNEISRRVARLYLILDGFVEFLRWGALLPAFVVKADIDQNSVEPSVET